MTPRRPFPASLMSTPPMVAISLSIVIRHWTAPEPEAVIPLTQFSHDIWVMLNAWLLVPSKGMLTAVRQEFMVTRLMMTWSPLVRIPNGSPWMVADQTRFSSLLAALGSRNPASILLLSQND